MQVTDEELMQSYVEGDEAAFTKCYDRHFDSVAGYRKARFFRDHAKAEDVAQSVFVKLFQNVVTIDLNRKVKPWLYKIAKHEAINELKYEGRRPAVSLRF